MVDLVGVRQPIGVDRLDEGTSMAVSFCKSISKWAYESGSNLKRIFYCNNFFEKAPLNDCSTSSYSSSDEYDTT